MRRKTGVALGALLWLLVILGVLFCALRLLINRPGYFMRRYEALHIEDSIGIPAEDCTKAVFRLIDYMEGRAEDIQLIVREDGVPVKMYNAQEIAHMEDVRELYQFWRTLSYCALSALACLLLMSLLSKGLRASLWLSYKLAWGVFGAALLAMLVWVLVDFYGFWTQFHYLFFDNMLWLMDPASCRMIRICPLELFYGIVLGTVLGFAAFGVLCSLLLRRLYKKSAEEKA